MHYPKLPNRKSFLEKGYTSIQMREYAKKCVESALRQSKFIGLTDDERVAIRSKVASYHDISGWDYAKRVQLATELALEQKNK